MMRIKYKIAIPFMVIIFVIPLTTMIIFNIIMHAYILKTSREDLSNAVETTNFIIRQQIDNNVLERQDQKRISDTLLKLKAALKTSKIATKTEIILFSRQGKLIYPRNIPEDSFLTEKLIDEVKAADFNKNKPVQKLRIGNNNYFVTRHANKLLDYKLIYILSTDNADRLIKLVNLVLISILAIATIIGLALSLIIPKSISVPINIINTAAKKIGQGEFITIKPVTSAEEIFELSNSINSMSASLERYDRSQRTFLQNASHELRTPLMSVQGYAEGIINGVFPDNVQAARVICDESRRLTSLVEQLLVLSRIENNSNPISLKKFVLNNLMREFVQRVNGLAIQNGKQLVIKESSNIKVMTNEELLSQVIINIVSNCIRFAKNKVEISLSNDDNVAIIKVADDGKGISEEDLPHVFDRFYKGKGGNFGLGLAIAKSSADVLKGHIEVRNRNPGAEFLITLPLQN